jgi:glycosyltransferase involved in cell wall biosynthesis
VVVQKSLAEGFGLTVAEAMWRQRPVVASRIALEDVHDAVVVEIGVRWPRSPIAVRAAQASSSGMFSGAGRAVPSDHQL